MSVLALDVGTTGVTAMVVFEQGQVPSRGYQEFPQHSTEPGWVASAGGDLAGGARSDADGAGRGDVGGRAKALRISLL